MKIVQVCGWYFPDSLGGTETYVAALAERLRSAGHDVLIAAPDPGAHHDRTYSFHGIQVYRYPIPSVPTRDEAQHRTAARGAEAFQHWIREQRPDVVHFHTFVTGVGPHEIRAARAAGARVFATTHSGAVGFVCQRGTMMRFGRELCDGRVTPWKCSACELQHRGVPRPVADALAVVPPSIARAARYVPGKLGTLLSMPDLITHNQRMHGSVLRQLDAFVVLTDWAHRAASTANGRGAPVLLNRLGMRTTAEHAAALRAGRRRPDRAHVRVAYVGRFDPIKGVHDLARAVRALPAGARVKVEFRGPLRNVREVEIANELKAIVGPDAWVEFGAAVEPVDIFEYLADIDLLCCPSRTLEGGPTVALEAMGVGTPVLATRIGALNELITDGVNGRLVPPGDWRALSDALQAIAADPAGTLETWRHNLPPVRTMDDVVRDYLHMYGG